MSPKHEWRSIFVSEHAIRCCDGEKDLIFYYYNNIVVFKYCEGHK